MVLQSVQLPPKLHGPAGVRNCDGVRASGPGLHCVSQLLWLLVGMSPEGGLLWCWRHSGGSGAASGHGRRWSGRRVLRTRRHVKDGGGEQR